MSKKSCCVPSLSAVQPLRFQSCVQDWRPIAGPLLLPSCELSLHGGQLGVNSPGCSKPVRNCGNAETNVPIRTLLIFPAGAVQCFSLHTAGERQREACTVLATLPLPRQIPLRQKKLFAIYFFLDNFK